MVKVKATVEFSFDVTGLSDYFGEPVPDNEDLDNWVQDVFGQTLDEYIKDRLFCTDEYHALEMVNVGGATA